MRKLIVAALAAVLVLAEMAAAQPVQAATVLPWQQTLPAGFEPSAFEKLSPDLRASLATLPNSGMVTAIVTMRDQADLGAITAMEPAARQAETIRALQSQASSTQNALNADLASLTSQAAGNVTAAGAPAIADITPFWIFNGFSITAAPDVIMALAARPDVARIRSNIVDVAPVAIDAVPEANLSKINAPALWALGRFGQNVVVATMDTGVDMTNPDIATKWRGGSNSWYDPYGQHPFTPADLNGHGTEVLGVIVGGSAGGSAVGVAPQAKWIAVKIFDDNNKPTFDGITKGFQWLLDPDGNPSTADAPQVVNNSWTFTSPGCDLSFESQLQALRAAGILPVFAAGNSGPNPSSSISPANNPSAFAVGAVNNSDQILSLSSRGPTACGQNTRTFPDVAAPGWDIRTTGLAGSYVTATGTSLAAPHAAGALALLVSTFPSLSVADQQAALTGSAVDLGIPGPDNDFGYGRLDALGAYQWLINGGFVPQSLVPITVTTTADTIANDNQCSLREAVIAANTNGAYGGCTSGGGADTIVFAPSIAMPATIALTTSGANEENALTGDLDILESLTISGTGALTIDGMNADRVFDIHPGVSAVIAGVTVLNGTSASNGGGFRVQGALNLVGVTVTTNQGGGIANLGGTLTLSNTVVTANGSFGIDNQGSAVLTMNAGRIADNQGSGVINSLSAATLTGVTVSGNSGGGLRNQGATTSKLTITEGTVISNSATSGGGIANEGVGASTVISATRVGGNSATGSGGGIFNNGGMSITSSTIDHNQARAGGGIEHFGGNLSLTNVTVSGNNATDNGGGLYVFGSLTARFATFAFNGAGGSGGNIYHDQAQATYSGVLVSNPNNGGNCGRNGGQISSTGNNLESTNTCSFTAGTDLVNREPSLGPLQANGGRTWTHALAVGSPAIDAIPFGINNCGMSVAVDQRGIARPQGPRCDVGAFEGSFVPGVVIPVHDIQGNGYTSPLAGQSITTEGVVTALRGNGFFLQDLNPDNDDATSEGVWVSGGIVASVAVGDHLSVDGLVQEITLGGAGSNLLSVTTVQPSKVTVLNQGTSLPAPIVLGNGGRIPPGSVIEDDNFTIFDPAQDGLDFYESLEGMRVQINDARVVGPTDLNEGIWVLADNGVNAGPRTERGGIYQVTGDGNPERIQLRADLYPGGVLPVANAGTRFSAPVIGIMDYPVINYAILVTNALTPDPTGVGSRETTTIAGDSESMTIATIDVNGLGGTDAEAAFTAFAAEIVNRLNSPDVVSIDTAFDNSGIANDGTTAADQTFARLIAAVTAAGGPSYAYVQIDPVDGLDGGDLGGNARIGYLYNAARIGYSGTAGDASAATSVSCSDGVPGLTLNPGRIDPGNAAFDGNRKVLAAQFDFAGVPFFVIGISFVDNSQDSPFFGAVQPPLLVSQARRVEQAQIVHDFAASILACDASARVVILGNVNDDPGTLPQTTLAGTEFESMSDVLAANTRQSVVVDGVSHEWDQMLVSTRFTGTATGYDVVHSNAEYTERLSRRDPIVARLGMTGFSAQKRLHLPFITK